MARFLPACRALPKVELLAHLNGCVRAQTLLDCAEKRASEVRRCKLLESTSLLVERNTAPAPAGTTSAVAHHSIQAVTNKNTGN